MSEAINDADNPLISICVPVLNEEESISKLLVRLSKTTRRLSNQFHFEYIFTDNNSSDRTWEKLQEFKVDYPEIRAFRFGKILDFRDSLRKWIDWLGSQVDYNALITSFCYKRYSLTCFFTSRLNYFAHKKRA